MKGDKDILFEKEVKEYFVKCDKDINAISKGIYLLIGSLLKMDREMTNDEKKKALYKDLLSNPECEIKTELYKYRNKLNSMGESLLMILVHLSNRNNRFHIYDDDELTLEKMCVKVNEYMKDVVFYTNKCGDVDTIIGFFTNNDIGPDSKKK